MKFKPKTKLRKKKCDINKNKTKIIRRMWGTKIFKEQTTKNNNNNKTTHTQFTHSIKQTHKNILSIMHAQMRTSNNNSIHTACTFSVCL